MLPPLRIALRVGDPPLEGFLSDAFVWDDVLDGEPPASRRRDAYRYCTAAPPIEAGATRVENCLLVTVGSDGALRDLEDRIVVAERALAPTIEAERRTVGAALERARRSTRRRIRRHRRRMGPRAPRVVALRAWEAALRSARGLTRGVATTPDRLLSRGVRAAQLLRSPEGRARVRRGLTEPHTLTPQQKAATLFVGTSAILAALVMAHVVVTLAVPGYAAPWRTAFFTFLYAYLTSLGPPLPLEPVLLASAMDVGAWPTYVTALTAKVLAAWMVFFLGDEANEKLREAAGTRPRVAAWLDRAERFAARFGAVALALFIAVPGLPDAVALYVFGSLHMRMRTFLLAVGLGGALLYAGLIFGVGRLLGLV